MKITVIGCGWVGLVTASCFAEFGFDVCVSDINQERIKNLQVGKFHFYEPGIESIAENAQKEGKLRFLGDIEESVQDADVIVIAVGTIGADGSDSDLSPMHNIINTITLHLRKDKYTAIIIKSTVPVGTCSIIKKNIKYMRPDLSYGENYDIISNPSFFREGSAIRDFMTPDRQVIGIDGDSQRAKDVARTLYQSLISMNIPFVFTNLETAELIRYATTSFVAIKMAFINELADLCDRIGSDINMLFKGIGLDKRIGDRALNITPGFGGSSYPRTIRILVNTATNLGVNLPVLKGAIQSNAERIQNLTRRVLGCIEDEENGLNDKVVTILGLSFKAQTDDIRESPSIYMIRELLKIGIKISAYDPKIQPNSNQAVKIPSDVADNPNFSLCGSIYDSVNQSNAVVIMTDWMEFRSIDFGKINELMHKNPGRKPLLMDFRNMFSADDMKGFEYISYGV